MLNSVDHDSMSGKHVGTTSGLIVTSGKSGIWPLATPKKLGFRKLQKFPSEGKRPRQKYCLINSIGKEAGHCLVCWEEELLCTCCYEH
jgi:hypothetical protein